METLMECVLIKTWTLADLDTKEILYGPGLSFDVAHTLICHLPFAVLVFVDDKTSEFVMYGEDLVNPTRSFSVLNYQTRQTLAGPGLSFVEAQRYVEAWVDRGVAVSIRGDGECPWFIDYVDDGNGLFEPAEDWASLRHLSS